MFFKNEDDIFQNSFLLCKKTPLFKRKNNSKKYFKNFLKRG